MHRKANSTFPQEHKQFQKRGDPIRRLNGGGGDGGGGRYKTISKRLDEEKKKWNGTVLASVSIND